MRGLEVVSVALGSVTLPEEDQERLRKAQEAAVYTDPSMGAAVTTVAAAEAMKKAAENPNGAMTGFMGMGMAMNAGGSAANLYAMGAQQQANNPATPAAPASGSWKCSCGATATGNFCTECGAKKPADGWTCACGAVNKGKFCSQCGAKKPADAPLYKCDKCGWEPEDPANPPKFCPECGDPFDDKDIK